MRLYYFETKESPVDSEALLAAALDRQLGPGWTQQYTVMRSERGKPCLQPRAARSAVALAGGSRPAPHFSISHTKGLWCCVFHQSAVGLDVERPTRAVNWRRIAQRYFTEAEQAYVEAQGQPGFLRLWVRKEAWLKYQGSGLAGGLDSVELVEGLADGRLELRERLGEVEFRELPLAAVGVVCGTGLAGETLEVVALAAH